MKRVLLLLILLGLATPAMGTEFDFLSTMRTYLGYYEASREFIPTAPGTDGAVDVFGEDDSGTALTLGARSRISVKMKASESLSGLLTIGFQETTREQGEIQRTYLYKF